MTNKTFAKYLSANDTGKTGSHQAGILVPRTDPELLSFFGCLDPRELNPDAWICCVDERGERWRFRYIYYNNKLHTANGTRNEYRLTHLTKYLRSADASPGDRLMFSATRTPGTFTVALQPQDKVALQQPQSVVLKGWSRVH